MEPAFIIRHYAGKVKYGVKVSLTFTETLKDVLPFSASAFHEDVKVLYDKIISHWTAGH